ncbi:hypothetical protein KV557_01120 [Kitasatospora aureofaciens]|uniref:hypothetical protein n=1 Tax=Kitasatospora aureofaciens TaxID=1894 RepID=UPI001C4777FE|nr:hypothetical protein [Kitasatospora aureofaciens]MBV6695723.1 hypothetical protein [Kitasatospora aureofaciens]
MITALVGVATLGAGFAGGFLTQSQVGGVDSRPQPAVTVTVPGPTVTVPGPTVTAITSPVAAPAVSTVPPGVAAGGASPTAQRVLLASPDGGRGGSKTVLTGQGFGPKEILRVSFVIKGDLGEDYRLRDLRDTMTDANGAFSLEVVIPSDLGLDAGRNAYLRARTATTKTETVFDLTV